MPFTKSHSLVFAVKLKFGVRVIAALLPLAIAESSLAATHYVDLNSANPTPPYTNWATAATVIQGAVDAAAAGDDVVVTNGAYASGGRTVGTNLLASRVVVDKPITLRSVSGPLHTIIRGYQVPTNITGDGAIRCVYLTNGAVLSGFTLTNGATRALPGYPLAADSTGAGVWCTSTMAAVSNCVIAGNAAYNAGGGAEGGTMEQCSLSGNTVASGDGGGAAHVATLVGCTLSGNTAFSGGGGGDRCVLTNCTLAGNSAGWGGGANDSALVGCNLTGNSAGYGGGASDSTLNQCTVTSNQTISQGGGVAGCVVYNSTVSGNSAGEGGGAYQTTLNNSLIADNSAVDSLRYDYSNGYDIYAAGPGGGASQCMLTNCTVTGNSVVGVGSRGGGAAGCQLCNCIVFYNSAETNLNFDAASSLNYCCTTPLPANGLGNISSDPQLASVSHLSLLSPCIGAGLAVGTSGTDIDGEPWANPPSIGCDELHLGSVTGALSGHISANFTNVTVGFAVALRANIEGRTILSAWEFGDGATELDQPCTSHAWSAPGDYQVTLWVFNETHPDGISLTQLIHVGQSLIYVAAGNPNPQAPYTSWATAATNIQDAVNVSPAGGVVLVTNGVYASGWHIDSLAVGNRLLVDRPLTVRSVNGPQSTVLDGGGTVRCVSLGENAVILGFTLSNGVSGTAGGGAWCAASSSALSNCVINGNSAALGGGVYGGSVNSCTFVGNTAGAGGGAADAALNNCTLSGNWASDARYLYYAGAQGGAAYGGVLTHCTLNGNSAVTYTGEADGGGAYGAVLNNCTLTNNSATSYNGGYAYGQAASGGGAFSCTLSNCLLSGNSAVNWWQGDYGWYEFDGDGGGVSSSTLTGCSLSENSQAAASRSLLASCAVTGNSGFGALSSTLIHCTIAQNTGGGVAGCFLTNSILYFNAGANYDSSSTLSYCCVLPLPPGAGNTSSDPQLADRSHITASSPCRGAGRAAYTSGTDIDGEPWLDPPSIGCDEPHAGTATGPLSVNISAAYTNVAVGYAVAFTAAVEGRATSNEWDFGDGTLVANEPYQTAHAWTTAGDYSVVLRAFNGAYPAGISATVTIHVVEGVYCVAATSGNPAPPFTSWATAATNIQDAVDAAAVGGTVFVTNGTYSSGGRSASRVLMDKPLRLCSLNGPSKTIIRGQLPAGSNGYNAIGCASLACGASLSGFTLTNGAAFQGGGVSCESAEVVVSNCVLVGNSAYDYGGGAYQGVLNNCTLIANSGIANGNSFLVGGAAYGAILNSCTLSANSAFTGGGAANCTLNACALTGNFVSGGNGSVGGGVLSSTLNNCTLAGNSAHGDGSAVGGAAYSSLNNCIVYFNTSPSSPNHVGCILKYCCTMPVPYSGNGNITNAPLFLDLAGGNLHLQSNSPCINAGNNAYAPAGPDLAGNPRIAGGTVDIGAYEYQSPASHISYAWLQQYGLLTDGSADFNDPDHDGMNNWQEWRCGTDPTNALSALRMLSPAVSKTNVIVTWQSVAGVNYFLERASNLASPAAFTSVATNIVGQSGTTACTDTNAAGPGPFFYRIGLGN